MDSTEGNSSGLSISRLHGKRVEDYGLWRMRLKALCRLKRVWEVVQKPKTSSSDATAMPSFSISTPENQDSASEKVEKASAIIILALGHAPLRVVMEAEDDLARMLQLLDARYASSRTVSRIAVQTQLFRMSYDNQNMADYIHQYTYLFSELERMGTDAAIPDSFKAPMLL